MAEALLRAMAAKESLPIEAASAGTLGSGTINPLAKEAMLDIGVSMEGQTPKILSAELVQWADRIISMGCGVDADACPTKFMVTEDWGLDDPAGQSIDTVRRIRDEIAQRINSLIREISENSSTN